MERDRIEQRTQSQDDIAPTLPARRTMVEFTEQAAKLGLLGMRGLDTEVGQAIEDTELLLAQSLVDADRLVAASASCGAEDLRGLDRADIG